MQSTPGKTAENPLTPTVLNQMLKKHLSEQFGSFWLSGEIFEYYQSPAGHSYFTLKDQNAGIKCVLFRQKHCIPLKKGLKITLLGQMSLYEPKGDVQVNVLKVIQGGQGDLEQQFLILKQKLMAAGLFDRQRKKPIPKIVSSVGIITSQQGAALQDILNVLLRQNPLIDIKIYHTPVQGTDAPPQINHALREADQGKHDVLLLTRGGGSKEDLWAFNDEFMAHQLAQMSTAVISAVGHETDESISDLVADMTCITPTAAAHFIAGDFTQLKQTLMHQGRMLDLLLQDKIRIKQQMLDASHHRLEKVHPQNLCEKQKNSLLSYRKYLHNAFNNYWQSKHNHFDQLQHKIANLKPNVHYHQQELKQNLQHLNWLIQESLKSSKQNLGLMANDLDNKNPLQVLARGYSVTTDFETKQIITDVKQVKIGDKVATQLKSGRIHAKIFERFDS
ncbi:MAG: exodeoxyribonuclease VII large subunit [Marinicella sp.]